MIEGSCLCGAIRFEVDKASSFWLCHCSKCRKNNGGPFAVTAICRRDAFRWTSETDSIRSYESASGYTTQFCENCGSPAPLVNAEKGYVLVLPGLLDDSYDGELLRHIFVASKAPWWRLDDTAPCFDEHVS